MKKSFLVLFLFLLGISCFSVYAAGGLPATQEELINPFKSNDAMRSPIESVDTLESLILKILQWLYTGVFIVAVVVVLMAAFTFARSGGDERMVKKAKSQLKWAAVGIAVGLVATGIHFTVRSVLLEGYTTTPRPLETTPITFPTPDSL